MNAYDRFSSSEIILYLYLVHICNQNYWEMPIACKTATLQSELGLNKSTIIRARVKLRERGLIDFTEGIQNSCSPKYRLLNIHSCKNATASATAYATDSATADETINKDIDMLEAIMDIQIFIRRRSQKAEKIEAKIYKQIEDNKVKPYKMIEV